MQENDFQTWAVVELMGHLEYSGFVQQEVIAGASMLRIDVPDTSRLPAFTKYVAANALYGITPVSEETARARAESRQAEPFQAWDIAQIIKDDLKKQGRLLPPPQQSEDEELPF